MTPSSQSTAWNTVRLEELVSEDRPITYGIVKPGPDTEHGIPYIRVVDMNGGGVRVDALRRTSPEIAKQYRRSEVQPGDLLLSIRGHVGRLAVVPEGLAGANITQDTARLVLRQGCHPRYVFWYLYSLEAQRWMERQMKGVAVRGINLADVKEIPVPVPPLPDQRRIAAILDKADAIQRKRQEVLDRADDLMQAGFMDIVGPGASDYESWPRMTVERLAAPRKGSMRTGPFGSDLRHSEFVDDGIAVLGIDNAVRNRFAWDERRYVTEGKYDKLKRYTVYPDDVIITIMGTTGRSAVVPGDIPTAITTKHLACITLNRDLAEPEFVSHAIHRHPAVLAQIGVSHRGAIMPGLNLTLIKSLELHTPPIEVQRDFANFVQRVRSLEKRLEGTVQTTDGLFNSLVQRAFKGEL